MSKTDYEKLEKSAPKDWQEVKLGELPIKIIDNDRGENYPQKNEFSNEGHCLFLNTKNVTESGFSFSELNFITEQKDKILRQGKLQRKDLVLTTRGTVGNVAYYNEKISYNNIRINSGMVIIRPNGIDENFNYQLFKYLKNIFTNFISGSAQPQLPIRDLKTISILFPPLPEQKAIAEVLSSLDDKIDLLQKQNQTLENIAQTLFRKYFIQNKKKDWEEMKLGQFFPIVTGKKNANHSTTNGKYPFFTCSQNTLKSPNYSFNGKAILLTGNGDFNVKRYEGKFEAYQRTYVLIPYKEKYFGFLFTLIKSFLTQITGGAQGSVIRFITHGMIADFKFLFPKTNIDKKLEQINNIYTKVDSNDKQIQTLEKLRNSLLPKLISGKIRINF